MIGIFFSKKNHAFPKYGVSLISIDSFSTFFMEGYYFNMGATNVCFIDHQNIIVPQYVTNSVFDTELYGAQINILQSS